MTDLAGYSKTAGSCEQGRFRHVWGPHKSVRVSLRMIYEDQQRCQHCPRYRITVYTQRGNHYEYRWVPRKAVKP